jgi:TonB-dependent starch-binding outer membrane protein SusC
MKKLALLLTLFSITCTTVLAQTTRQIKGRVVDETTGQGIPDVSITVPSTGKGTKTSGDGSFTLTVEGAGKTELQIGSVGYEQQTLSVDDGEQVVVRLKKDTKVLDDVVVIGYGTQKKRNVTGAVASFDAKTLDQRPVLRVDQALVGQMAGVAVKQTTGALGKGISIQVRGTGSISAGNEPLYVIDGFPLTTAAPNASGNYATGSPLDNINPNDIENIQVLKDAAAAAIYGSRAANGVVLITTRRGQAGKTRINFNTYVGYAERSRKLEMLDAEGWIDRATEMINAQWVASGAGRTASQTNDQRRAILGLAPGTVNTTYMTDDRWTQPGHPGLRYVDWQDEVFRKGLVQNHQVSASGGTDIVRYYVSGNFTRQEGMVINTDYTSYSARANVEVNANKKLRFGLNLAPTYSINNDPGVEGKDNILHQVASMTPVQEDTMGLYPNIGKNGQYQWSVSTNGAIGKLQNTIGQTKRFRTLASIFAEYQVIKGLTLKTTVNLDNIDNTSKGYTPYIVQSTQTTRAAQLNLLTSGNSTNYRKQAFVNENTINYNTVIKDVHDISVLAGMSYNSGKIDQIALNSQGGFSSNVITTLNAANAVVVVQDRTFETKNVLMSYFGRVQYSYDNKYLLSGSIRRDGSSRFGSNSKWGLFPSASVGWRVSNEKFMSNIVFINDLKLRASWGRSGNYNIPDYGTISTLAAYNYTLNGASVIGQAPNVVTNPDLTWEQSETFDVGLDITLWKNRITASFDYYSKSNTDLLLNVPIPTASGFASYLSNAGSAKNKGWEIEVSSRNTTGKLQWTTSLNLSHNTNKVTALAGGQNQILIPSLFDIPHAILRVGEPMYSIFAVRQIGILSQDDITKGAPLFGTETAGDPKYFDADGNGTIDANDRMIVGHPNPDYIWGVTNTFRYKGFDLTVLVQGQWGGSIYSLLGRALGRTGQGSTDNALGFYDKRWRSASDPGEGRVSKAYSTFGRIINTDWLYSSDYIRVRNITLGYDLGSHINKKYLQGARFYVTLENFFGHDKYDGGFNPEATNTDLSGSTAYPEPGDYGGLPLPRSLIVGLNINF